MSSIQTSDEPHTPDTMLRKTVRWGVYPITWLFLIAMVEAINRGLIETRDAWLAFVITLVAVYIALERIVPYQHRWSMTLKSFINDLKYLATNGATVGIFSMLLGIFAISSAGQVEGIASNWPFMMQLIVMTVIFEALQYGLHRYEHEGRGTFGNFMWRIHSAHHLPDKVYIMMHVAGHPINAILVQGIIIVVPIWIMGYSELAVTVFLMINSMHGLLSHFNVDARIGFMNYVFIGPELHRYHHSAKVSEGKNYGATISLFDLLFGTFVYKPGLAPAALGVAGPENYPMYGQLTKVLLLPFKRN